MNTSLLMKTQEYIRSEHLFRTKSRCYEYCDKKDDPVVELSMFNILIKDSPEYLTLSIENLGREGLFKQSWRMMLTSVSLRYDGRWEHSFQTRGLVKRTITLTLPTQLMLEVGRFYILSYT